MKTAGCGVLFGLAFLAAIGGPSRARPGSTNVWRFAVSGDSRNCGDVVMPGIAKRALAREIVFYWHLGDFRLGRGTDEDMQEVYRRAHGERTMPRDEYLRTAWQDFRERQLAPFGSVAVYVGLGNHELMMGGTAERDRERSHEGSLAEFSRFMEGSRTGYYGWRVHNVDFINLDNSRGPGFEPAQLEWLRARLGEDENDAAVRSVVVGMHRALPNSLSCGHGMNGSPGAPAEENRRSTRSGREAYRTLWEFQHAANKRVYVLASHAHLYMEGVFNTPYWTSRVDRNATNPLDGRPLEGWVIGTAGAVRFRLPDGLPREAAAITYVYGYLLATVGSDGEISFEFEQIAKDDLPNDVLERYRKPLIDFCFLANRDAAEHSQDEASCREK